MTDRFEKFFETDIEQSILETSNIRDSSPESKDVNIQDEFIEFRTRWTNKMLKIGAMIKDIELLTDMQLEALTSKSELIAERLVISDSLSYLISEQKKLKEKEMVKSRSNNLKIKNQTEQNTIINSSLSEIDYKIDLFDNHLSFITSTINTIDNILYAIKDRIKIFELLNKGMI